MDPLSQLREGEAVPVYVLVGGEPLLRGEALAVLRARFVDGPAAAFNDASFTAGNSGDGNALDFADAARAAPMMASKRFVLVRQVEDANRALLEALHAYVQKPVDTTVLVLIGEKFPARDGADYGQRITNAVKKTGWVGKLEVEPRDRAAWAQRTAKRFGVGLDSAAVDVLLQLAGPDLAALVNDVEKCANFVGDGGVITEAVAHEVCVSTADVDTWGLTNAIIARDPNRALECLHRSLEDGEASHKLIAGVAGQLRQALIVQDALRRGIPVSESGARLFGKSLAQVSEMVKQRPLSPSALLEGLADANKKMNSSRAGDRRVFEAWVVAIIEATR